MPMKVACSVHAACVALAALVAICVDGCTTTNIHDTPKVRDRACADCHGDAYNGAQSPVHVGVYPNTCADCHGTQAWIPATGGHPEDQFPITTGSHANAAIGCTDCHLPSLGSDVGGQNTNCIDCHIGAHRTPSIDGVHANVSGYTPSSESAPHSCLASGCHPSG
jgi:hypothetical protein